MSLSYAVNSYNFKEVKKLIRNGANIHETNQFHNDHTPIMYSNSFKITTYLIKKGANLYLLDYLNNTVLHLIFQFDHRIIEYKLFLYLTKKVPLNIKNYNNCTILYLAFDYKKIALLCKSGSYLFVQNNKYHTIMITEMCRNYDDSLGIINHFLQILI